jgi:hypothetical protein
MATWIWVVIAVVIIVAVVGLAVFVWQMMSQKKTQRLQSQFGSEYDRTVQQTDNRREAEAELEARNERLDSLDLHPLPSASRERYLERSRALQGQFVDEPALAVSNAERLIDEVMSEQGYPMDDFEQRAADISAVDPQLVEHYREGHRLARVEGDENERTEALRQAMRHYRALLEQFVETGEPRATTTTGASA